MTNTTSASVPTSSEVREAHDGPGRFSVYAAGTTWHCGHLHQTEAAAVRCLPKFQPVVDGWAGATLTEVTPGLFEARLQSGATRRFRFVN